MFSQFNHFLEEVALADRVGDEFLEGTSTESELWRFDLTVLVEMGRDIERRAEGNTCENRFLFQGGWHEPPCLFK